MNKLAYLILHVLDSLQATDQMNSASTAEIHEEISGSKYSYSATYKKLRDLVIIGYVMTGIKDGSSNTFYITESGKRVIKNLKEAEK